MKRKINLWDYAPQILTELKTGVLLTVKADGEVNTMSIGWGTMGIEWQKPIFILPTNTNVTAGLTLKIFALMNTETVFALKRKMKRLIF